MPQENLPSLHILEEAKMELNKAESAWKKTSKAFNRLRRERLQTKGEVTEAERDAQRAYELTSATLDAAREHWKLIKITMSKPKSQHAHKERVNEVGLDEHEVE